MKPLHSTKMTNKFNHRLDRYRYAIERDKKYQTYLRLIKQNVSPTLVRGSAAIDVECMICISSSGESSLELPPVAETSTIPSLCSTFSLQKIRRGFSRVLIFWSRTKLCFFLLMSVTSEFLDEVVFLMKWRKKNVNFLFSFFLIAELPKN